MNLTGQWTPRKRTNTEHDSGTVKVEIELDAAFRERMLSPLDEGIIKRIEESHAQRAALYAEAVQQAKRDGTSRPDRPPKIERKQPLQRNGPGETHQLRGTNVDVVGLYAVVSTEAPTMIHAKVRCYVDDESTVITKIGIPVPVETIPPEQPDMFDQWAGA